MRLQRYLVVGFDARRYKCRARLTQKAPVLDADEVAVYLDVHLPDTLFKKPALTAEIQVPEDQVNQPVISADIVDNIAEEVGKQLGVELSIAVVEPQQE